MPLVPHGFPDWYRLSGRADEVFLRETFTDLLVTTFRGPYFVGSHQSLMLFVSSVVNHCTVTLHYLDAPSGNELGVQVVSVREGLLFNSGIPVTGPWLLLELTPGAAVNQYTVNLFSAQLASHSMDASESSNLLIAQEAVSVPAGGTSIFVPVRVWFGEATWSVFTNSANWFARLRARSRNNTPTLIDAMAEQLNGDRRLVFLPSSTVEIVINNLDAVPQDFWVTLGARPILPGA